MKLLDSRLRGSDKIGIIRGSLWYNDNRNDKGAAGSSGFIRRLKKGGVNP